jgi:hypothetical protein
MAKKKAAKKATTKKAAPKKSAAKKAATKKAAKKRLAKKLQLVPRQTNTAPPVPEISAKAPLSATLPPPAELEARQTRRKKEGKQAERVEREAAFKRSGTKKVAGHISARGRRQQAARDARNG